MTSTTHSQSPVIIITGASAGIGEAAARELVSEARVIIVGRSDATKRIADELGIEYFRADYSNLASVHTLAQDLLLVCPRIDIVINNAGGVMKRIETTHDGFELTFQTNYLAQFVLTNLLMDRLIQSKAGIINTSSAANLSARLSFDNLQKASTPFGAYANSKLLDVLHAQELSRRYSDQGVVAVSYHPGIVATSFAKTATGVFAWLYNSFAKYLLKSPHEGADTMVWLVRHRSDWQPGGYYAKRKLARTHSMAKTDGVAKDVWTLTEHLIN